MGARPSATTFLAIAFAIPCPPDPGRLGNRGCACGPTPRLTQPSIEHAGTRDGGTWERIPICILTNPQSGASKTNYSMATVMFSAEISRTGCRLKENWSGRLQSNWKRITTFGFRSQPQTLILRISIKYSSLGSGVIRQPTRSRGRRHALSRSSARRSGAPPNESCDHLRQHPYDARAHQHDGPQFHRDGGVAEHV